MAKLTGNKDKVKTVSQYLLSKAKPTKRSHINPVISADPKKEKREKGRSQSLER